MTSHIWGYNLVSPQDLPDILKYNEVKHFADLHPKVTYFDKERVELIALDFIPSHPITYYDMRRVKIEVLEPLRQKRPDLFLPENRDKLFEYVKPLLKQYRAYTIHLPAAEPGDVLLSVRNDGLWDNVVNVDFYPLFLKND